MKTRRKVFLSMVAADPAGHLAPFDSDAGVLILATAGSCCGVALHLNIHKTRVRL